MTDLIERARKFRRFDGDCACPSLINELANRVEKLESTRIDQAEKLRRLIDRIHELEVEAEFHPGAPGAERVHELTSALRHVQTELNIAVGSFGNARRAVDVALDGKRES
jgi:hypothetical protein